MISHPRLKSAVLIREQKEGAEVYFIIKNQETGKFFKVGEYEGFLMSLMRGDKSLEEMRAELLKKYDIVLDMEELKDFTLKLMEYEMIDGGMTETKTDPVNNFAKLLSLSAFTTNRICSWFGFMTNPFLLWIALLIVVPLWIFLTANLRLLSETFYNYFSLEMLVIMSVMNVLTIPLHEVSHGVVLRHFGQKTGEAGIGFHYFYPVFFINTNDAWLLPHKHQRILVSSAGTAVDLLVGSIGIFGWMLAPFNEVINKLSFCLLGGVLYRIIANFNLLLQTDGYFILADWTGLSQLKKDTWIWVKRKFQQNDQDDNFYLMSVKKYRVYLILAVLSILLQLLVYGFGVYCSYEAISEHKFLNDFLATTQ